MFSCWTTIMSRIQFISWLVVSKPAQNRKRSIVSMLFFGLSSTSGDPFHSWRDLAAERWLVNCSNS